MAVQLALLLLLQPPYHHLPPKLHLAQQHQMTQNFLLLRCWSQLQVLG
jgi:hypothetical protein